MSEKTKAAIHMAILEIRDQIRAEFPDWKYKGLQIELSIEDDCTSGRTKISIETEGGRELIESLMAFEDKAYFTEERCAV